MKAAPSSQNTKEPHLEVIPRQPLIISGPCSAESEEQVLETAHLLKNENIDYLRAGVWKPRTRPNTFEGVGEEALLWLNKAKQETGLPFAIEVANAKHVEIALKHGVDMVWIGARTSVSPFAVQDIADALRGVDIPVMVKNPMNPDLDLWLGAIERIQLANVGEVMAIHRGFSTGLKSIYRNEPKWDIPLELKSRMPHIRLICDPSHIAGSRHLLKDICDQAIQLKYDGLIIESHRDPDAALSDAKQQIRPSELANLINFKAVTLDADAQRKFEQLRREINILDSIILETIQKRMNVAAELGELKKKENVSVFQYERFVELLKSRIESGAVIGLHSQFVKELYHLIHNESVHVQQEKLLK
jgi:chorismate mutase